jgi:hypothetical protein
MRVELRAREIELDNIKLAITRLNLEESGLLVLLYQAIVGIIAPLSVMMTLPTALTFRMRILLLTGFISGLVLLAVYFLMAVWRWRTR